MTAETFDNLAFQERRFALLLSDNFSESDQVRIQKSLEHAKRAHEGQERDGGTPYSIHPIRVAMILIDAGERDTELIIAGLLHDVVEDCEDTVDDIVTMYGERVGGLVKDATRDRPEHETEEMKRDAKPRKFRWYIHEASVDSCKLKSADVIDNMRCWQYVPADHPTVKKFSRWCNEAETFYPDMTQKAGGAYFELFRLLAREYQALPQFTEFLTGDYS